MKHYTFKSKRLTWAPNDVENVQLDFLPTVGKRRGRLVIDRINVHYSMDLSVDSKTGAVKAIDFASNAVKNIRIFDAEGNRRLLTGFQANLCARVDLGDRYVPPGRASSAASLGIYNGLDIDGTDDATDSMVGVLPIMFNQYLQQHRGKDFAFPVDDLLNGGGIELSMPALADIVGTDVDAITEGFYEIEVVCQEAHDFEYHSRDVRQGYTFQANTEFYIPVSGKLLRELLICRPAANGGSKVNVFPTVNCEPYNFNSVPYRHFMDNYLIETEAACSGSAVGDMPGHPVLTEQVLPLVYSGQDGKIPAAKLIGGQLYVQFPGGSNTAITAITHVIAPKSAAMAQAAAASNRVGTVNPEVRTKGESDRSNGAWDEYARFMPAKQV